MKAETIIGPASIVEKPSDGMFALVTKTLKELRKWRKENFLAEEGPYFVRYYHFDMKSMMG